ncbi:MAG TPA: phospholipid carrier-dependent glycosyltransferase [Caldilineae bacterium]|nr:phospholipid carrier-dependent glycosyltransferase [Caldilineae bacterium]
MDRFVLSPRRYAVGLFLIALLLRVLAIGYPIEVDSFHWLHEGADFLRSLLVGDWYETYGGAHPGVTSMWLVSAGLALEHTALRLLGRTDQPLLPWLNELLALPYPGLAHYVWVRLIFAPITAGLLVAIYRLGARAFDGWISALAAALLLFEPYYLAHARVIVPDALASSFVLLAMLAMLIYLRSRGGERYLLVSGLCLGLAVMSKLPTIVAGPLLALWLVVYEITAPWAERRGISGLLRALLLLAGTALLTAWALWPALWITPGPTLARWWADLTGRELGSRLSFFMGERTFDPGPLFYPVVLLFRSSPLTLLGALVALGIGVAREGRRAGHGRPLIVLMSFTITLMLVLSLDATKIDRYLLPALPPLAFVAAWGWIAGLDLLAARGKRWGRWGFPSLVVIQAVLALAFYPDYFSYYNPLLGGPRVAQRVMLVGVGEGLDIAAQRLASLPDAADLTVAAWYPGSFAPHFPGRTVKLADKDADGIWNWARSHFVVSYINQWQRQPNQEILAYFKGQPVYDVVRLHGVDYVPIFPGPMARPDDVTRLGQPPVDFGGVVRLRGVELGVPEIAAGSEATVTFYWELLAPFDAEDSLVTLVVRDEEGNEWGRSHGPPVGGFLPLSTWRPGMLIRDVQRFRVLTGTPPGSYRLLVGWYSPGTRRALEARRADGTAMGDLASVATLQVTAGPIGMSPDDLPTTLADVAWGDVRLVGWHLPEGRYPEGGILPLTLYWRAARDGPELIRLRLHLEAEDGRSWSRAATRVISPRYPPERWQEGELVLERWNALLPAGLPDGTYAVVLEAERAEGRSLGRVTLGRIEVAARPHVFIPPTPQHEVNAWFGEHIWLLGYDVDPLPPRSGEPLQVTLYWQADGEIDVSYMVFVHALGPDGNIVAQVDRVPVEGQAPTTSWLPGEVITDTYTLALPGEDQSVQALTVGLYEPRTGQRLPAVVDGVPSPDGRVFFSLRN